MKICWFLCALLLLITARLALAQNQVLDLDGQGSYVQLPAHIFDALQEATVEAWVKWEEWGYFSQWFAFGADNQWRAMGLNHFAVSSNLQFFLYPGRVEGLSLVRLPADLPLGHWCHMAAVSGRGGMRLYLNGVLVGSNSFEGSFAAISPGENNYLGRSNWRDNAYFHGQLDEVRVWSAARSAEEIRASMGQVLTGNEEGLVGLWNFDGGDARDQSPQGHDGQMLGGARGVAVPFPGTGAWVRQVNSGEEALAAVRQERPDLVFMDIRMAGMDGIEVLRRLRREHGALPVVAVSASVMQHQRQDYLDAGFDAFLEKPFRLEALYACLEQVLGVQYEYVRPEEVRVPARVDFDGLPLPASLRAGLRQAAEMHNVTDLESGLEQLSGLGAREGQLAVHLGQLVRSFDLAAVLRVLERTVDG